MTGDPFKIAADLARTLQNLKPIGQRPAWRRAELLAQEMRREALELPDDHCVDEPKVTP